MICGNSTRALSWVFWAFIALAPGLAQAAPTDKVKIDNLVDVNFGTITNLAIDHAINQSICVYSTAASGGYSVTATGGGSGGAFTLATGGGTLPFEVQWASSANQTTGTTLQSGVTLTGQTSNATQQKCNNGPPASASLIIILRATALGSAPGGTFSGTLALMIAPN
jgi:hypothetical protein